MIADLTPYPEYKDSGLPWLGLVPKHWEVKPAFACYSPKLIRNIGLKESTVLSLSFGQIIVKPPEKLHGLVPESFETYQIIEPGNIIIRATDLQNDRTSLRVAISRNRGIITSAYLCLQTKEGLSSAYGYRFLSAWDLTKSIYGFGSGLRQNLDFAHFKRMPVPVPASPEQIAIENYLNSIDIKVRRFIRNRRRLIGVLNEQKQAIINRAVTRGLDPDVPLKPSGIDWIGDIPQHWRTTRLSRLSSKIGDGLHGTPQYVDISPYHFINGNNLVNGEIRLKSSTQCVGEGEFRKHGVILDDSSLLMSINGTIGNVAYYRGQSIILGKSAAYINCGSELSRTYLFFFLQSLAVVNFLQQEVTGTTIFNLSLASIRSLPIALPSLGEQLKIVLSIEDGIVPVSTAITRLEREIELLREYRTRLIADVVTGKVDVRHLVPAAAELEAELEDLEDGVEDDLVGEAEAELGPDAEASGAEADQAG